MKKVSVIGAGWVGKPLVEKLVELKFDVKHSNRNLLQIDGSQPFEIDFNNKKSINLDIFKSEILIFTLPPSSNYEQYYENIKTFKSFINSDNKQIIFLSSISVYDSIDKTMFEIDSNPNSQIGMAENILLESIKEKLVVLRLGGLIGNGREPAKFLSGKENLPMPNASINLVHQIDVVNTILFLIQNQVVNEIFNCVYPINISRKEYYTQKCIELNLKEPNFNSNDKNLGKIVSSKKLIERGFEFEKRV